MKPLLSLLCSVCLATTAIPATLSWDRSPATDAAVYRIYSCPGLPCTVGGANLLGVLEHSTTGERVAKILPEPTNGQAYIVTAVDHSNNESMPAGPVQWLRGTVTIELRLAD